MLRYSDRQIALFFNHNVAIFFFFFHFIYGKNNLKTHVFNNRLKLYLVSKKFKGNKIKRKKKDLKSINYL